MNEDTEAGRTTRRQALWWVWNEKTTERASERLVLIALAYSVDEQGIARVTFAHLAERTRLAVSTVKAALRGLSGKNLVEIVDKGRGRPYEYLLDLGRNLVDNPPGSDALAVVSHNAFRDSNQRLMEPTDVGSLQNVAPRPMRVGGRDLAFDAVQEVCGIRDGSPRMKSIPRALNGEDGIRAQAWLEISETHRSIGGVPVGDAYEELLAEAIRHRAVLYRQKLPGMVLTAPALAKWWTDLPGMSAPSKHGTARDALAVAAEARRNARGEA